MNFMLVLKPSFILIVPLNVLRAKCWQFLVEVVVPFNERCENYLSNGLGSLRSRKCEGDLL